MSRQISSATSPDLLKQEAKRWLKAIRAGDADARARFDTVHPAPPRTPGLRDAQLALAREYGHDGWIALVRAVEALRTAAPPGEPTPAQYETLANDLVDAFDNSNDAALQRVNSHYLQAFTFDDLRAEIWRRVYAFRTRTSKGEKARLLLAEAQTLIAQNVGFSSWPALLGGRGNPESRIPPFAIDPDGRRISPRRNLSDAEWNALIEVMRERQIPAFHADGLMTDAVMARMASLEHVTELSLGGSRQLTDEGLLQLARMPQLETLSLNEYPGGRLTDRGLEVLRHLPNLRRFEMTWQRGISDAGAALLRHCDRIERVDLMGSPTGDAVIEALQGKPNLRVFSTGRLVTDTGLALLKHVPRLTVWDGERREGEDHEGARLLIDGPFTDQGLASIVGLAGVGMLDLFWHVKKISADGFTHLVDMANVRMLGADGALSSDEAMVHIARMPQLRAIRIQETVATDEGFETLSRSQTLESIWGRDCPHLRSRGFAALSKMPALRSLGVGCRNVEDWALALLPQFPALRELTPVGVTDPGFRHIGLCERIERLTCMYCRDTTDAATEQITRLPLKYYYAGLTQITDRSLELLGGIESLENVELYECNGVTDAGVVHLARLPHLREVHLDSLPGVTLAGTAVFPPHVRVHYST